MMQLARVGHPLVDEHHARTEVVEEAAKGVAGARALFVIGGDTVVANPPAQLPGELDPQSIALPTRS